MCVSLCAGAPGGRRIESSGTSVTEHCVGCYLTWVLGTRLRSLERQPVFPAAEQSLQPPPASSPLSRVCQWGLGLPDRPRPAVQPAPETHLCPSAQCWIPSSSWFLMEVLSRELRVCSLHDKYLVNGIMSL